MRRPTEILRNHAWCTVIVAAVVILAILTVAFGGYEPKVSYISFAAGIVSIILAVIVIFYTGQESSRWERHLSEIKTEVVKGVAEMASAGSAIKERADDLARLGTLFGQSLAPVSVGEKKEETGEVFSAGPSRVSGWALLALYSIQKAHDTQKSIAISSVSHKIAAVSTSCGEPLSRLVSGGFWCGILQGLVCFLEPGSINLPLETVYEVPKFPVKFKRAIVNELARREKDPELQPFFQQVRLAIDEHFAEA